MDVQLIDAISLGLRTLFLSCIPVAVVVAVGASIGGAVQSATGITDSSIGYAVRLFVGVFFLYYYAPAIAHYLAALVSVSWGI